MTKFDYAKAQRREDRGRQFAHDSAGRQPRRHREAHPAQHDQIISLCKELNRTVMNLPEMAYDARLEIERLTRIVATQRRMEVREAA